MGTQTKKAENPVDDIRKQGQPVNMGINSVISCTSHAGQNISRENFVKYIKDILENKQPDGFWTLKKLLVCLKENAAEDGYAELSCLSYAQLYDLVRRFQINLRTIGFDSETLERLSKISRGDYPGVTAIVSRRAEILLLRAHGKTQKEIAGTLHINEQTVHRCISKYLDVGLEKTLFENPKVGRPSKNK